MAETTLSDAARRMRRQRRLAQRTGETRFNPPPRPGAGRLISSVAIVVGLTVGTLALLLRESPTPLLEEPLDDAPIYTPDGLRPALGPPTDTPLAMPATYLVEEGDTLLSVAYRFGAAVESIRLASSLANADLLEIGQALVVPPAWSMLHEIDPSATLRELAEAFGLTVQVAAAYNGLTPDLADEELGRSVVVVPPAPIGSMEIEIAAARVAVPEATASDGERADAIVYTVAEGDTILDIAGRLGVDPDALVAANVLPDSDWIVAGDQLAVPLWARPAQNGEAAVVDQAIAAAVAEAVADALHTPAAPRTPVTYEVEEGDTVLALAARFGVDAETIVATNDLISADRIKIGQELTILPVSGLMYTVQRGDTLADIAATFKVDLGPIIDFNYLEDANFIAIGKELIIPGARPLPPPPPRPAGPTIYEVQPGDSVLTIARKFGITSADVVAANGLRSADRIGIGDKLTIRAGAGGSGGATSARSTSGQQTVTRNLPVPGPSSSNASRLSIPGAGGPIASLAMQYSGSRYVFGGTTPSGFDCSGFVYYVLNRSGKSISRGMWGQYNAGSHPGRGELQPGDMVFFQNTYMAGLSHNGIYIGGGQFIHASDERSGVKVSSLSESYWASRWFGATRAW